MTWDDFKTVYADKFFIKDFKDEHAKENAFR